MKDYFGASLLDIRPEAFVVKDGDKFVEWLNSQPRKNEATLMGCRILVRDWVPEDTVIFTYNGKIVDVVKMEKP